MNRKNSLEHAAHPFRPEPMVFEIAFEQAPGQEATDPVLEPHFVIVQVETNGMFNALSMVPDPENAAQRAAEEVACQVALQTIEKDLPQGVRPPCSPLRIDHLPDGLQGKAPTLCTPPASAWLV